MPRGSLLLLALSAVLATACSQAPGAPAAPTFARDIAPLVHAHCAPCHRPGNIAPFSLLTYDDARAHAREMLEAIELREMPPWLPEAGGLRFRNARGLTDAQVAVVRRWISDGTPRGVVADEPAPPEFADGWQLGTPDLVVRFPEAYTLKAGEADVFRNFVVPVKVSKTVYVRGVEFRPDHPASIHHAVIGVDASGESRRLDVADPEPGYEGMFSDEFHSPDGHFVGWTPGRTPTLESPDMAWRLDPGTDLVVQLHLLPSADPVPLQPSLALYFSDVPPTVTPFMVKLTSTEIDIPAGSAGTVVEDAYTLPVDVEAVSVYPHAHYLAREITGVAELPSGERRPLLTIRNWDFHWQEFYRYETPIALPAGTTLRMTVTYDNSAGHQPKIGQVPVRVRYGPRSSDEMADLWLQVIPKRSTELDVLARDFVRRRTESRIAAAERAVQAAPGDAGPHDLLGNRYLAAGRLADAVREFRQALRLKPDYPEAANNLGVALLQGGRPGDAVPYLRQAAAARPADPRVHFNLGNALRDSGDLPDAYAAFERALALQPDAADVLNNLAVLDGAGGRIDRALERLSRALQLREDYAEAHHNMALALAEKGRVQEALTHVDRAIALRQDFEQARQTRAELLQRR
jgi:Flp pilus assembly protein TadD